MLLFKLKVHKKRADEVRDTSSTLRGETKKVGLSRDRFSGEAAGRSSLSSTDA